MELVGNEKRIQALFSELSLEDRTRIPGFEQVWKRAATTRPAPAFRGSIAALAAVAIVAGAISLLIWSWSNPLEDALAIAPHQIPAQSQLPQLIIVPETSKSGLERRRVFVRKRQVERNQISDAELLSRWQSPTRALMVSPTEVVLDSLPQLNQAAKDLESFLPKNK